MPTKQQQVGGYHLGERLGSGAYGEVFEATRSDGAQAAVKFIAAQTDREWLAARQEVETLALLWHPNVVALWDSGEIPGAMWLAMERGLGSLEDLGPADGPTLWSVVRAVLDGLMVAHTHGIIHRDLKPANLIWSESGPVRIADFGAAWKQGTANATAMGTRGFMAPEVRAGDLWDLGPWTDLYALGRMVDRWLPTPNREWAQWTAWLTEPNVSQRPPDAATALRQLPLPPQTLVEHLASEPTGTTRAWPQGSADWADAMPTAYEAGSLPTQRPTLPRRADRVSAELQRLVSPPLYGRDDVLDDLWATLVSGSEQAAVRALVGPRGMGHTAVLDHIHALAARHGAAVWRATPDASVEDLVRKVTRADRSPEGPARWCQRHGAPKLLQRELSAWLQGEGPRPPRVLEQMLEWERQPRVVLAERPNEALRMALADLQSGEVAVAVVLTGPVSHSLPHTELGPVDPSFPERLASWSELPQADLHALQVASAGHPGVLVRALRGAPPEAPSEVLDDSALQALAWWPEQPVQGFLQLCAAEELPVQFKEWVSKGWVTTRGAHAHLTNGSWAAALRALPLTTERAQALAQVQTHDGRRAEIWNHAGDQEKALDLWLSALRRAQQDTHSNTTVALTAMLLEKLPPNDPRRPEVVHHRLSALLHVEGRGEELDTLAAEVVADPTHPSWELAVNAMSARWLLLGKPEKSIAWFEAHPPTTEYLLHAHVSALFDAGRYDEVLAVPLSASSSPSRFITHGEAALMTGDLATAKKRAHQGLEVATTPIHRMSAYNLLGASAFTAGDLKLAEERLRAASESTGARDRLQPLTNVAIVVAIRGRREEALALAEYLLPRLTRLNWAQNLGWVRFVLWACIDDPEVAESFGKQARAWCTKPSMPAMHSLTELVIANAEAHGRSDLAAAARTWAET